ncbi:MAG: type I glyceraldehyde-3-phosphate dehydrogenase [Phycisphaeraceae bacterium]
MTLNIGINGFGRIGRQAFRIAWNHPGVQVVHINDLVEPKVLAHLLKYDSTYGTWDREIRAAGDRLIIDDHEVTVSAEKNPADLPWADRHAQCVLESTGIFRKREQAAAHLEAGAERVLISAPGKNQLDGNFVIGVNEEMFAPQQHRMFSIGSCTTNALAPMARVLQDRFGIRRALMTTVHAYTADQSLVDGPHRDLRRARAAAANIIPTSTGAAKAISLIIPELEGRIDGMALRVPVLAGSIVDLTAELEQEVSAEQINDAFREVAGNRMKGVLTVAEAPLVSSDIVGTPFSCTLSPEDTYVVGGGLVKTLGWYDNEWGFSSRLVDMMGHVARTLEMSAA